MKRAFLISAYNVCMYVAVLQLWGREGGRECEEGQFHGIISCDTIKFISGYRTCEIPAGYVIGYVIQVIIAVYRQTQLHDDYNNSQHTWKLHGAVVVNLCY